MSSEALNTTATGKWGVLRAGVHHGGGLEVPTVPTDVATVTGKVRLAIGPNEEPRVLLPLKDQEAPTAIRGGSVLSVSVSSFNHKGQVLRFLDLICLSPDLESVFGEVVDEMLARIARGDTCVDAARSTIDDFRSLLMRAGSAGIDKRRVAGLIAELLVLNRLLDRSSSAWKAWTGPTGQRHDFMAGSTSLEVKASLRPGTSRVTINGLEQLEAPTDGTLHLLHMVLEPVSSGMLSVSSLARSALSKADEPERVRNLLAAVNCTNVDADEWNGHRFQVESEHLYHIRPRFPRLVFSMLTDGVSPLGVHGVSYQIDLSVAKSFLCEATVYANLEQRLCP